jgi:FkbM family methyltransferase
MFNNLRYLPKAYAKNNITNMPHLEDNIYTDPDFKPFHSYSLDGEDMLLRSLLTEISTDQSLYKGFFIDIGAHHPFRFSNTAYFYEAGWQGINIEPTPAAIKLFHQHRDRDINLAIGIGAERDKRTLYCFADSALNTFDEQVAESYSAPIIETAEVDIFPLAQILDEHLSAGPAIDFMNIDVAGLDLQLLESNNWDKYRPKFVLVEDVDSVAGKVDASEVHSFLNSKGYELVYKTPRTLIYRTK